jgi:DNA-binding LacI/PurR family transcriptional regulator
VNPCPGLGWRLTCRLTPQPDNEALTRRTLLLYYGCKRLQKRLQNRRKRMNRDSLLPTIDDVAQRAGVSASTVSRVINRKIPVSPEAASRVEAAMKELRYVPRAAARNLATQQTNTVGLLFAHFEGDFFGPLLTGIGDVVNDTGFELLISNAGRHGPQSQLPASLGRPNTDGVLIFADALDDEGLAHLASSGSPAVLIHQSPPAGVTIPCVTIENKAASSAIVDHLITVHGRRQIAFLQGPAGNEDSYWREMGYRAALKKHQLPVAPALIGRGDFDRQVARATVALWLAEGATFDAIFTGDDEAAVGALQALREAGRQVPEDVAVVGFDDQRLAAVLSPSLTTVHAPTERVGRVAAEQLFRLMRTGNAEPLTLLPTRLVIRRSCGCAG